VSLPTEPQNIYIQIFFGSMISWNCLKWVDLWTKVHIFSLEITLIGEILASRYASIVPFSLPPIEKPVLFLSSASYTFMLAKYGVQPNWLWYGVTTNVAIWRNISHSNANVSKTKDPFSIIFLIKKEYPQVYTNTRKRYTKPAYVLSGPCPLLP
jgi:hypothetical protein